MKAYLLLAGALALLPLHAAESAASKANQKKEVVANPRYSRERLDRIRAALSAQIAVQDAAENAMRSPTAAEAAALQQALPQSVPVIVPLQSGGVAMRTDVSNLSFSVAVKNPDGSLTVSPGVRATKDSRGESHDR